jgi:DNA-binding response OmpR family regulator
MNVLIVDDQESMRGFIARVLEAAGYTVDLAQHGGECVEKCQHKKYDVILLDLVMPVMDGECTLRELKKKSPESEVVIISVQDDEHAIQELLDEGATAYLCKPFTAEQLKTVIREVVANREARAGTGSSIDASRPD